MAFEVFISYSTKDLSIVERLKRSLENPAVKIFIAETSVTPGSQLAQAIVDAIKNCEMFVLLWSRNSRTSEWVPQEIGIARGLGKIILPVVLEPGLELPGFIKELKYLEAFGNPDESLIWLRNHVFAEAQKQQQTKGLTILFLGGVILWLLSQKK